MTSEEYMKDVKQQLYCNASEEYRNQYITYGYTEEEVDKNLDYFEKCRSRNLSAYKALFDDDTNRKKGLYENRSKFK